MRRLPSVLLLILLLSLLGTAAADSSDLPSRRDRWIQLTTPNFTFFSNAGERTTRRVALDLEELRALLSQVADLEGSNPLPVYVYVFKHDRAFNPYKLLYQGKPSVTAGYFLKREHANYISINGGARTDASGIVYHEFVHYYASTNLPNLPTWFEEGLAELYQTFEADDERARIGIPIGHHLARLKSSTMMPLAELFAVDRDSPVYNEGDRKGAFYAQSWAMVHYLLIDDERRRADTRRFVDLLQQGVSEADALALAYSIDIARLETQLRRYLDRRIYTYLQVPMVPVPEAEISVHRLNYADVLFRLGDLLAQQSPARPEVDDYLNAAIAEDPEQAQALAAMGRLAEDRARWDAADKYYRRALAAGANDPLVSYRAGAYLLRRGGDAAGARAALAASVRLDPDYGPAWVALTGTYMAVGDHGEDALAAAENAHRLLPSRTDVTLNLIRLYLSNGRRTDAVALAERAFANDPDHLGSAYAIVGRSDLDRARRLVADGQPDMALPVLAAAERAAARASDREMLQRHVAAVRSNILEQRITARYNDAVAAFNAGAIDDAREILVDLTGDELPGRHADAVQSFLEYLDNPDAGDVFPPPEPPATEASPGEIDRLNQLITAGRLEEALIVLADLRQRVSINRRSWVDAKIDEIRGAIAHNRFAEAYNRAVNQYNGGAFAAAAATLEELLTVDLDDEQAASARRLLAEARAQLAD